MSDETPEVTEAEILEVNEAVKAEQEAPSGVMDPNRMNGISDPSFGEDVPREVWDTSYGRPAAEEIWGADGHKGEVED